MSIASLYLGNRLIIDSIYTLIVVAICVTIYLRTAALYKVTGHKGIRYFSLGALYYSLGFIAIYAANWHILLKDLINTRLWDYTPILLEYLMIMGGFYITYSLLWKRFDDELIIKRIILLHIVAIAIAFIDIFIANSYLMYFTQIMIGSYAAFIIYANYRENSSNKFTQFYFISMVCNIIGWVIYLIAWITHNTYPIVMLYTSIIIISAFIILLYGVLRVTGKHGKEA